VEHKNIITKLALIIRNLYVDNMYELSICYHMYIYIYCSSLDKYSFFLRSSILVLHCLNHRGSSQRIFSYTHMESHRGSSITSSLLDSHRIFLYTRTICTQLHMESHRGSSITSSLLDSHRIFLYTRTICTQLHFLKSPRGSSILLFLYDPYELFLR
jgi:hypothetical protein